MTLPADFIPTIAGLQAGYRQGHFTPVEVIDHLYHRYASEEGQEAWILRRPVDIVRAEAERATTLLACDPKALDRQPLLGIPFAVKDNIDVAGLATTAACPAYEREVTSHATVVQRLLEAGALLIGKTNLDQFATGLVGTRSPYGAVRNPFHPAYMSGGSSSGSAAATARGWVAFSLGTDTAGSGRVPAGACNLVGLKPTPGLVSTHGVLPACRTLDCVSVFAHTVDDGWQVLSLLAGPDDADPYSRHIPALGPVTRGARIGVPAAPEFFGDALAEQAWAAALDQLGDIGQLRLQRFDLAPFLAVARLLYEGPWVAERRAALGSFFDHHGDDMDSTVYAVVRKADELSAADAFRGKYELARLRRRCLAELARFDALVVPTAPALYRHDQIDQEPIVLNSRLGTYTNFVNLLGMAALALPGPFRDDGLPAGITLLGAAGTDHRLAELARQWQPWLHRRLGQGRHEPRAETSPLLPLPSHEPSIDVAVVGAHLAGLPLNWQLTERGAVLREATLTSPHYRLYALPGSQPPKPGLVRAASGGDSLAVEIWSLPLREYGAFVADIPAPLGIGTLTLDDGRQVQGFLCEAAAVADAQDITAHGGWRAYLGSLRHG